MCCCDDYLPHAHTYIYTGFVGRQVAMLRFIEWWADFQTIIFHLVLAHLKKPTVKLNPVTVLR